MAALLSFTESNRQTRSQSAGPVASFPKSVLRGEVDATSLARSYSPNPHSNSVVGQSSRQTRPRQPRYNVSPINIGVEDDANPNHGFRNQLGVLGSGSASSDVDASIRATRGRRKLHACMSGRFWGRRNVWRSQCECLGFAGGRSCDLDNRGPVPNQRPFGAES